MRGHSLSSPEVLRDLAPYVVTHWNGRKFKEMPDEVRAICSEWRPTRREPSPLLFFVFDAKGEFVRAFEPMPEGPPNHLEEWKAYLLDQFKDLARELKLKKAEPPKLQLPDVKDGIRLFIKSTQPNVGPANYKVPICEVVAMKEERTTLAYPRAERSIEAADLGGWLNEFYPAAIMDGSGKPVGLTGSLTLAPAGSDGAKRYAILRGEPEWTMDDARKTKYRGTVEIVLTYPRDGDAFTTVRGVITASYLKKQGRDGFKFEMSAALESRPE